MSFQLLINQQGIEKLNYNDLSDSLYLYNATQMFDIIPEFEFPTWSPCCCILEKRLFLHKLRQIYYYSHSDKNKTKRLSIRTKPLNSSSNVTHCSELHTSEPFSIHSASLFHSQDAVKLKPARSFSCSSRARTWFQLPISNLSMQESPHMRLHSSQCCNSLFRLLLDKSTSEI